MLNKRIAPVITVVLIVAGCASIISGRKQDISISSSPSTANVEIERVNGTDIVNVWKGTTPATVELKRKHSYLLTVSTDGHKPVEMSLKNGSNGWVWGNLLFGGIIGFIVDFSNGAAKTLEPDEIHVDLVSATASGPGTESNDQLYAVFSITNRDGSVSVSPVPMLPTSATESSQ